MTKKARPWRGRARTSASVIKSVNKDSFASAICPTNIEDQKKKFLQLGKTPEFQHRGTEDELEEIYSKPRSEIRFELLGEALHILNTVKDKYGDAETYYTEMYGLRITKEEGTDIIVDYLKDNNLDGQMSIIWCTDLPCSGRMMWQGPHVKYRRPEARKYSMWIKDSTDNNFLRVHGIRCLADHEIGTHFFRSYNDGLQPWFADRTKFGIRSMSTLEQLRTEEGLAAINTVLNGKIRYLWGPALLYYIACKATEMTFKQLFEHLTIYVQNPEWRWRHCVRVKRGMLNPNDIGGYGKDQCYFEGAVDILRNVDTIDFNVLMSGKICHDEINRVRKLARLNFIQMPAFMKNQERYKKILKQIAHMNGLHLDHPKFKAPVAYIRRLKKGRRIGVAGRTKKYDLAVDQEIFYDSLQKSMEDKGAAMDRNEGRVHDAGDLGDRPETNMGSRSFYGYGNNDDDLDTEKAAETKKATEVTASDSDKSVRKTHGHDVPRDWDTDCMKSVYKCVSRSSVHNILNQPSTSLNSRRNSNNSSVMQRPHSSVLPGKNATIFLSMQTSTPPPAPSPTTQNQEAARSREPSQNAVAMTTEKSLPSSSSSTTTTKVLPISTFYNTYSTTTTTNSQSDFSSTNQAGTGTTRTSVNPHGSGSPALEPGTTTRTGPPFGGPDVKHAAADGSFIYPDIDLLTDDVIKIDPQYRSHDLELANQNQVTCSSANQVKLLHRRVKSAANILPKA